VCKEKQISTVCVGKPSFSLRSVLLSVFQYRTLLNSLSQLNIDLIIIA
jgi:two-component system sensor histidine kinase KdpD